MNNLPMYLNTALGACFIILLIFLDYVSKYNTDTFQRRIFFCVLGAAFLATIADFFGRILLGLPGGSAPLYVIDTLFYIFQTTAYYFAIVFIDYFAYNDMGRAKKFIRVLAVFLCLYYVSVFFNVRYHFYFYISPDNFYTHGPYYSLRLAVNYLAIPICFVDMLFSSKAVYRAQIYLIIFFGALTGAGAALDVIMGNSSLAWPCFAAALLYFYFFIIRSDSMIECLPGIGNLNIFN
jgi:hypothetical protein